MALIHRAFHAIPFLSTKDGVLTNAVFGFTSSILTVLKELDPQYIAVSFDLPEPTFRHQQYAEYKATRQKAPDELKSQFGLVRDVVEALGIPIFEMPGYEADDVLGSLGKGHAKQNGVDAYIVTGDRDELQLVDEHVKVYMLKWRPGGRETVIYDPAKLKEDTGLTATEFVEYKALLGDTSDNIPGVPGVGQKTATALIQEYGTLEKLYQELERAPEKHPLFKPKVRANLLEFKDQAFLSRDLSRIKTDIDLKFDLEKCRVHDFDMEKAIQLFHDLEFSSLVPRLKEVAKETLEESAEAAAPTPVPRDWSEKSYHLVDSQPKLEALANKLAEQEAFAFDTETEDLDAIGQNLVGLAFSWGQDSGHYVACRHDDSSCVDLKEALKVLKPIFENPQIKKIGHHLKYDFEVLRTYGIETQGLYFDTLLASYLLNPGARTLKLDLLARQELGYEMQPISELIGEGRGQLSMRAVKSEEVVNYAAEDVDVTWQLYEKLGAELRAVGLDKVLSEIELPLVPALARMEQHGVLLDTKMMEKIAAKYGKELAGIETKVHKLAGKEFNLNSPSQLAEVLFEELKIGEGMTKRGGKHKSTAAAQLERYRDAHPVVPLILRYREVAKLKSTYLDALPKLVRQDTGRVHTSYSQTTAATGRLSSNDPNLQNIPIRTEEGRYIRQAFTVPKGYTLISADYSQFELRIAAHFSGDQKLSAAFKEGQDIHTATAANIAGVPLDEVQPAQRYAAKTVNFSILYGAGPHNLSRQLDISVKEAQAYIDRYFQTYPKLREYMDAMITKAQRDGFVETLFGRRRYLPEIQSSVFPVREAAKRMAINMPIQGTQADILKMAMINIDAGLPKVSKNAQMILTVHDELVFEVPTKDLSKVGKFVVEQMEHAYELKVPIVVEAKSGPNWGELQPL